MRNLEPVPLLRRQIFRLREQIFERPQHQRQRRSELVT
jgi:hypothetical protein